MREGDANAAMIKVTREECKDSRGGCGSQYAGHSVPSTDTAGCVVKTQTDCSALRSRRVFGTSGELYLKERRTDQVNC